MPAAIASAATVSIDRLGQLAWFEYYQAWDYRPGGFVFPDPGGIGTRQAARLSVESPTDTTATIRIDLSAHFTRTTFGNNMEVEWNPDSRYPVLFPNITLSPAIAGSGPDLVFSKSFSDPFEDGATTSRDFGLYATIRTNCTYVLSGRDIVFDLPDARSCVIDPSRAAYGYADLQSSLNLDGVSIVPEPSAGLLLACALPALLMLPRGRSRLRQSPGR
jgi:hypothetical protein